jgi:hypothetical protein
MKNAWILLLLAVVACTLSGCNGCGGLFRNWFNRGSNCCPPPSCPPGAAAAPYSTGAPVILGAPAEGGPVYGGP